ncbi:hypothetical protein [Streptococcus pneumoniae]|uniref:Uncharacterized protein n=1 Tax=Streptococcus pneumoniae TaxID=1313 RepID=A0A7X2XPY7_STREE|nr:hypothetical protein [Streptococcus pneumoniae]MTV44633.1 hypothetical protein [Streptococcus pneumoniae]
MTHAIIQPEIAYLRDDDGDHLYLSAVPDGYLFAPIAIELEADDLTEEEFFEFLKSRLITI